jgi:hypothetical protein
MPITGESWAKAALQKPVLSIAFTRFCIPWPRDVRTSRANETAENVQPPPAQMIAERGASRGNPRVTNLLMSHVNVISTWGTAPSMSQIASPWPSPSRPTAATLLPSLSHAGTVIGCAAAMRGDGFVAVRTQRGVHAYHLFSRMAEAVIAPDANVNAPIAAIAHAAPNKSVRMPAANAPIA